MAKLIYIINTSLDGYIEDASGNFDWSEPDDVDHDFYTELLRPVGTQLLGRRMYEMMQVWQDPPADWPSPRWRSPRRRGHASSLSLTPKPCAN